MHYLALPCTRCNIHDPEVLVLVLVQVQVLVLFCGHAGVSSLAVVW